MTNVECDWCGASVDDIDITSAGEDFICNDCAGQLHECSPSMYLAFGDASYKRRGSMGKHNLQDLLRNVVLKARGEK